MDFVSNGGMKKTDYLALKQKQILFAYVSLLLAIFKDSVTAANGSLAMDLCGFGKRLGLVELWAHLT